jgi:hypothetical protein
MPALVKARIVAMRLALVRHAPGSRAQAAPTGGLPAVGRLRATGPVADGQDRPVFLAGGAEVKVADGIDDHSVSQARHSGAAGHGGPVAAPV